MGSDDDALFGGAAGGGGKFPPAKPERIVLHPGAKIKVAGDFKPAGNMSGFLNDFGIPVVVNTFMPPTHAGLLIWSTGKIQSIPWSDPAIYDAREDGQR